MTAFNKQACFNELSFLDKADNEDIVQLFDDYAHTIKTLKQLGFSGVRYEHGISSLSDDNIRNFFDLKNTRRGHLLFQIIQATARNPYIDPDSPEEEEYITNDFEVEIDGEWRKGEGFTAAYLNDTITVSLRTHPRWEKDLFTIRETGESSKTEDIFNAFQSQLNNSGLLKTFISLHSSIELKSTSIKPKKKIFKAREDHGIDKLELLWKRLRNCAYVVSAINSLEFNPHGRQFVEKCFDDGKIHIRLVDSDPGYGMVIQTTGRTKQETEAIGKILFEKYA